MATIETLQARNKLNRSKLFKRAHYLMKTEGCSFGSALKEAHREIREYRAKLEIQIEGLRNKLKSDYAIQPTMDEVINRNAINVLTA